jgi:hypothetical protein
MIEDADRPDDAQQVAANDNGSTRTTAHMEAAVLIIARLIGRQMAREGFERRCAANDNRPLKPHQD